MKTIKSKIPAIIAMSIYLLAILGIVLVFILFDDPNDRGLVFGLIAVCALIAIFGCFLHLVDSVLCIIKAIKRIDPVFNVVLASCIACMEIFLVLNLSFTLTWLITTFMVICPVVFVLETISIIRIKKCEKS